MMLMIDPLLVTTGTPPTRASAATYHDASGVLLTAAIDGWRPIVEVLGSTNMITQSNIFTAGTASTSVTLSTTVKGPDASTFAHKIAANSSGIVYADSLTVSTGMIKGATYGASVYVKTGTETHSVRYASLCLVNVSTSASTDWMFVDLLAGSVISTSSADHGKTNVLNTTVEVLANGWVRLGMTFKYPRASGTGAALRVQLSDTAANPTPSIGSSDYIHAFGWQLEAGPVSSYIPTSGAVASRSPDVLAATTGGSELIASNIPLGDYAAWNVATAYVTADRVVANLYDVYEAIAASTGVNPVGDTTAKWLLVGKVNRFRMFDGYMGTYTSAPLGDISVTIRPDAPSDSLVIWASAAKVLVSVVDDLEGLIYTKTVTLRSHVPESSWYGYFFAPQESTDLVVLTDLPLNRHCLINVQVLNSGGSKVMQCLVGRKHEIGQAQWGASTGINDYSDVSRDTWGNPVIVERSITNRCEFAVVIDTQDVNRIKELLRTKKTKPCVYIGALGYRSTAVYGYYKALDIVLSNYVKSDYNLEIEELT